MTSAGATEPFPVDLRPLLQSLATVGYASFSLLNTTPESSARQAPRNGRPPITLPPLALPIRPKRAVPDAAAAMAGE
jgi:hypothetical protein